MAFYTSWCHCPREVNAEINRAETLIHARRTMRRGFRPYSVTRGCHATYETRPSRLPESSTHVAVRVDDFTLKRYVRLIKDFSSNEVVPPSQAIPPASRQYLSSLLVCKRAYNIHEVNRGFRALHWVLSSLVPAKCQHVHRRRGEPLWIATGKTIAGPTSYLYSRFSTRPGHPLRMDLLFWSPCSRELRPWNGFQAM